MDQVIMPDNYDDLEFTDEELLTDTKLPEGYGEDWRLDGLSGLGDVTSGEAYGAPTEEYEQTHAASEPEEAIDPAAKLLAMPQDERHELYRQGYRFDFKTGEWSK